MLLKCGIGEDSWESLGQLGDPTSPSSRNSVLNVHWKDWCWSSKLRPPDEKNRLMRKDPDVGKDWREERGTTKDEMVGWHHRLNGHEFEQALDDGEGQGNLACYSPWGSKSWTWLSHWMTTTKSGDFPDHTSAENAPCREKESYVKECFTQTHFWENPSCLRDVCIHMGGFWDMPNMANQND